MWRDELVNVKRVLRKRHHTANHEYRCSEWIHMYSYVSVLLQNRSRTMRTAFQKRLCAVCREKRNQTKNKRKRYNTHKQTKTHTHSLTKTATKCCLFAFCARAHNKNEWHILSALLRALNIFAGLINVSFIACGFRREPYLRKRTQRRA